MTLATVTERPLELEPATEDAFLDGDSDAERERAAVVRARIAELFGAAPRRAIFD